MSDNLPVPVPVAGGCCVVMLAVLVAEILALIWAVQDITGFQAHKGMDIVVFVVVGLMLLGGGGARGSVR